MTDHDIFTRFRREPELLKEELKEIRGPTKFERLAKYYRGQRLAEVIETLFVLSPRINS